VQVFERSCNPSYSNTTSPSVYLIKYKQMCAAESSFEWEAFARPRRTCILVRQEKRCLAGSGAILHFHRWKENVYWIDVDDSKGRDERLLFPEAKIIHSPCCSKPYYFLQLNAKEAIWKNYETIFIIPASFDIFFCIPQKSERFETYF